MKRTFVISVLTLITLGSMYAVAIAETVAVAVVFVLFALIGIFLCSYFAFCKDESS